MYWIFLIFCICTVAPLFLIEIFVIHRSTQLPSAYDPSTATIVLQLTIFLIVQFICFSIILIVIHDFVSSKFTVYFMVLATIAQIITAYNPWISWCYANAESAFSVMKYSLMLQVFYHPIGILVSIFIPWISFRMRSIDRDMSHDL
ncbi:Protein CBG25780 [Caenorhabditis briggsae]|uniref:Protein CBG25780 n=1 Tax=Caenorhabditis briggsae TaxID=6238 RepID=B6IGK3_CAEBR|nr:Protein CBG25780 [Caenorhabditis briggsae]CAR99033.1 Protein CBG25780 [Caenorhabditis briggsae]